MRAKPRQSSGVTLARVAWHSLLGMGSSFVNVQVHAAGRDPRAALDGVVDCLVSVLREDGFVRPDAGQSSDRTVLVAAGSSGIGVYDEICDKPREEVAARLASELSRRLETHAVTILVHDSDVLVLELFGSGELLDRFNSNPGLFGEASTSERTALRGKPARWNPVLLPGVRSASLGAVWRKRKLLADDTLREIAQLLGIEQDRALLGFRYLEEGDAEELGLQVVSLRFRHAVRPAHETLSQAAPRLQQASSSVKAVGVIGQPARFSAGVRNLGGAASGISVLVYGDAIDGGLLSIDSVQLVIPQETAHKVSRHAGYSSQSTVFDCATTDELRGEHRVSRASFPELKLEAGPAATPDDFNFGQAWDHYSRIATIHANIFATAVNVGKGAVHVGFVPDSASEGHAVVSLTAEVFRPAALPLRAPASSAPRPEQPEHALFALVSVDLEQREAAAVVAPIIERFCEFLEPAGEFYATVYAAEQRTRPRSVKLKPGALPRGARWQKLKDELRRAACVGGERQVRREQFFARQPSDGFCFGGSLTRHDVPGDPTLPTLVLWFDLEGISSERALAAEALFEAALTEVMERHSGVQAMLGRTTVMHVGYLDLTEYESACGFYGACVLRRSWLTRFLRTVVVGKLWLGESLTRLVPDTKKLAAAARVEVFARMIKITVASRDELRNVELALADLLPSHDDFRLASDRIYDR